MSDATSNQKVKERRRKKLTRVDLQLKIVFITLFVASLVLLVNFQLTLAGLWSISSQLSGGYSVNELLESVKESTIRKFLFSVVMAVPLAGFVGILYSFKFCGPIYRFKKYFTELKSGRWDERCMLRKGDDLQDVAHAINEGMGCLRERIREDQAVLREVESFLSGAVFKSNLQGEDLVASIRERIVAGRKTYEKRFPADGKTEPVPSTSSAPTVSEELAPPVQNDLAVEEEQGELEAQT